MSIACGFVFGNELSQITYQIEWTETDINFIGVENDFPLNKENCSIIYVNSGKWYDLCDITKDSKDTSDRCYFHVRSDTGKENVYCKLKDLSSGKHTITITHPENFTQVALQKNVISVDKILWASKLTTLWLSQNNKIQKLQSWVFQNVDNLTTIYLSDNDIFSIEDWTFDWLNINHSITIELQNNQLTKLPNAIWSWKNTRNVVLSNDTTIVFSGDNYPWTFKLKWNYIPYIDNLEFNNYQHKFQWKWFADSGFDYSIWWITWHVDLTNFEVKNLTGTFNVTVDLKDNNFSSYNNHLNNTISKDFSIFHVKVVFADLECMSGGESKDIYLQSWTKITVGESWTWLISYETLIGGSEVTLSVNKGNGGGADYQYVFSWWENSCGDIITRDCVITGNFMRVARIDYDVTFVVNSGNYWRLLDSRKNPVIGTIWFSGASVTITGNAVIISGVEFTASANSGYVFSGWNNGCWNKINKNCTITATFRAEESWEWKWEWWDIWFDTWWDLLKVFTVMVGWWSYWTVNISWEMLVLSWTLISISGDMLVVWWTWIIATPYSENLNYTYSFLNWNNTCGNRVAEDCIITANFTRTIKSSWGGGSSNWGTTRSTTANLSIKASETTVDVWDSIDLKITTDSSYVWDVRFTVKYDWTKIKNSNLSTYFYEWSDYLEDGYEMKDSDEWYKTIKNFLEFKKSWKYKIIVEDKYDNDYTITITVKEDDEDDEDDESWLKITASPSSVSTNEWIKLKITTNSDYTKTITFSKLYYKVDANDSWTTVSSTSNTYISDFSDEWDSWSYKMKSSDKWSVTLSQFLKFKKSWYYKIYAKDYYWKEVSTQVQVWINSEDEGELEVSIDNNQPATDEYIGLIIKTDEDYTGKISFKAKYFNESSEKWVDIEDQVSSKYFSKYSDEWEDWYYKITSSDEWEVTLDKLVKFNKEWYYRIYVTDKNGNTEYVSLKVSDDEDYDEDDEDIIENEVYVARSCKEYNLQYLYDLWVYSSSSLNKLEYFVNLDYFKRYIDSKNKQKDWCPTNVWWISTSYVDKSNKADRFTAPNGKVYFISENNGVYSSKQITSGKTFKSLSEIKYFLRDKNPLIGM